MRLSARTAGEMDLEKTEFSMCPTTIRILARIMWHIRRVDDVHNYDHIYQSDLCGWVGKIRI